MAGIVGCAGEHCQGTGIKLPNIRTGAAAGGDPLAVLITDSGGAVGWALQGFSLLALATSFIGTCTGAFSRPDHHKCKGC
jgi:hypothetical protein